MAEPLIFVNSYSVTPGKEREYEEAFREVAAIVEEQEPRMLYFAQHVSEDGATTTTVQVHSDPENLMYHMQVAGEHIQRAPEYLDWSSMSIDVYGTPTEAVLEQMRQLAGTGVSVTVNPAVVSLSRLPEPHTT